MCAPRYPTRYQARLPDKDKAITRSVSAAATARNTAKKTTAHNTAKKATAHKAAKKSTARGTKNKKIKSKTKKATPEQAPASPTEPSDAAVPAAANATYIDIPRLDNMEVDRPVTMSDVLPFTEFGREVIKKQIEENQAHQPATPPTSSTQPAPIASTTSLALVRLPDQDAGLGISIPGSPRVDGTVPAAEPLFKKGLQLSLSEISWQLSALGYLHNPAKGAPALMNIHGASQLRLGMSTWEIHFHMDHHISGRCPWGYTPLELVVICILLNKNRAIYSTIENYVRDHSRDNTNRYDLMLLLGKAPFTRDTKIVVTNFREPSRQSDRIDWNADLFMFNPLNLPNSDKLHHLGIWLKERVRATQSFEDAEEMGLTLDINDL